MMLWVDDWELATQHLLPPDVRAYQIAVTGLKLINLALSPDGPALLCDISWGQSCPVIAPRLWQQVFLFFTQLVLPKGPGFLGFVVDRFVWHDMRKDVACLSHKCFVVPT